MSSEGTKKRDMPLIEEVHSSDDEGDMTESRFTRLQATSVSASPSSSSSSSSSASDSDSVSESSGGEGNNKVSLNGGVAAAAAEHRAAKAARARTRGKSEETKARSGPEKAIWIGLAVIVVAMFSLKFFEGTISQVLVFLEAHHRLRAIRFCLRRVRCFVR